MGKICDICSSKCFGASGYDGGCCTLEGRDFIIGPHHDADEFIKKLSNKLGREVNKYDIFIEHEEGSKLLPNNPSWQRKTGYPALRVDLTNKRLPCIFYNTTLKYCTVYDIRPNTCKNYECEYLKNNK